MEMAPITSIRPLVPVDSAQLTRPILLRPTFLRLQRPYRSLAGAPAVVAERA